MAKTNEYQAFWDELERLTRSLGQIGPDEVCCAGLSVRQCGILRTLAQSEGARLSDLAESAGLTPSAMTRMIEKLEARGLVKRVRGTQQDGRAAMVAITPAGRQVRSEIDQLMLERTRAIVSGIPAEQRGSVLTVLRTLNEALQRASVCCTFNSPDPGSNRGSTTGDAADTKSRDTEDNER